MGSRTKNYFLILSMVLVLFLCYKFAIVNTMELRNEYNKLLVEETLYKDNPKQLSKLAVQQRHYDSILKKMNLGNTSLENNLLRVINIEAEKNNLKVMDFNNPHVYLDNDTELNTYNFSLEGNFANILKAIYTIEQKGSFGEIIHVDFKKNKDYKTNKNYLRATVFLQNVK